MSAGLFVVGILHAAMWDTPMVGFLSASVVTPRVDLTVEVALDREDGVVRLGLYDCQSAYRADDPA